MVKSIRTMCPPVKRVTNTGSESKVQHNLQDQCDINVMLKKFKRTGVINMTKRKPIYGDFSSGVDFKEAADKVIQAQEDFNRLPAELRLRFKHNPYHLLEFLRKDENRAEAIELGLIVEEEKEPDYVPVKLVQEEKPSSEVKSED